jgi:DNA end-binding protein Ku
MPREMEIREKELEMAKELIDNLTAPFEADKYHDHYRERLLKVIQARVEGKEVVVAPSPEREKVVDLLEALRASVERTQDKKGKTKAKGQGRRKIPPREEALPTAKK